MIVFNGNVSVSKHFPGHGDTDVDSHKALPVLPFTRARLDSEMKYRKEGVSMGLPSLSEYEIFRTSEAEVKKAREVLARL